MQALADADIELENASTWGRIAALPGNCRFHLENEVFWRLLRLLAVDVANASPRHVPIATGHEQEILAPVTAVLCF